MEEDFEGLPGIQEHLTQKGEYFPVNIKDLGSIVEVIQAHCNLTEEQSERVLSLFFQEIRALMLEGKIFWAQELGKFFISSPETTGNKIRTFPKFYSSKELMRKLNGR